MKYLINFKTFETVGFGDSVTGIGADEGTFDHTNSPVTRQHAEAFVDDLIKSQEKFLFKELGIKKPKLDGAELDSFYDQIRDKAIKYFTKHPHRMINTNEMDVKGIPVTNGAINDVNVIPKVTHGH